MVSEVSSMELEMKYLSSGSSLSPRIPVLFKVSISGKRREWKVRLILKSSRETVKDGIKLKNESKEMTEKYIRGGGYWHSVSWMAWACRATIFLFSYKKHLFMKACVLACAPIFPAGSCRTGACRWLSPPAQDACLIIMQSCGAALQKLVE